jgi:hypothetical protein
MPHGPASHFHRLAAAGLALTLLAGAGAGSLAIAAQAGPEAKTTSRITGAPKTGGFKVVSDYLRMPHGEYSMRWIGEPKITFDRPGQYGGLTFLVDGAPAPAGFRPEAVDPKSLAWIEGRKPLNGDDWPMTLDFVSVTPKTRLLARYEMPSAADFQEICASGDPQDAAFCAGTIRGALKTNACTPEGLDPAEAQKRVMTVIAASRPRDGELKFGLVKAAVAEAFPCPA